MSEPWSSSELSWMTIDEARAKEVPEEVINQALINADVMIYGHAVTDQTGKRIDPNDLTPSDGRG